MYFILSSDKDKVVLIRPVSKGDNGYKQERRVRNALIAIQMGEKLAKKVNYELRIG